MTTDEQNMWGCFGIFALLIIAIGLIWEFGAYGLIGIGVLILFVVWRALP